MARPDSRRAPPLQRQREGNGMALVSLRILPAGQPGVFEQYLLPQACRALRGGGEHTLLGAVWDTRACGAAAVRWEAGGGELLSLYVDPQARGCGVAGHMVDQLLEQAGRRGIGRLYGSYVLQGEALAAMDALVRRRGGRPEYTAPVYSMDSACFHRSILGAAFRPGYVPARAVVPFSGLSRDALEQLEQAHTIPEALRPSALEGRLDPALSLAWMEGGQVAAYLLGTQQGEDSGVILAAWRGPLAPPISFLCLLRAQLHLFWYRLGGDFRCCLSAESTQGLILAECIGAGRYELYQEHSFSLAVPSTVL